MRKFSLALLAVALCQIPNSAIAEPIKYIYKEENYSISFATGANLVPGSNGYRSWHCFVVIGTANEKLRLQYRANIKDQMFLKGSSSDCNWSNNNYGFQKFAGGNRFNSIELNLSQEGYAFIHIWGPNWTNNTLEFFATSLSNPRPPVQIPAPLGTASTINAAMPNDIVIGSKIKDCDQCPEMVVLPAGEFMMGSLATEVGHVTNEGPRHRVAFSRPFAVSATEVTFNQWDACVAENACKFKPDFSIGRGKRPVLYVTYNDALSYVGWLSQKTGQQYFLPSESEWEYAARGGSYDTPWHTGDAILAEDANILNQFDMVVPTGSYPPNGYGLYDIHGNVAEWTQDCLDTGYIGVPTNGAAADSANCDTQRILRGGSYAFSAEGVRTARREFLPTISRGANIGFRVTRAIK